MMIAVYIVCTVVGVGLALIAAITGGHTHDADAHLEIGHDLDHDVAHDGDHETASQVWLPFLSLRFWTYGLAGFGLTGLLISLMTPMQQSAVVGLASGTGLVCGTMIAVLVRIAMRSQSDSSAHIKDMLGVDAEVLVAIRPGKTGKVRFMAKGETIDMLAISDDSLALDPGSSAIIVAIEGDKARVVARDSIFGENVLLRS